MKKVAKKDNKLFIERTLRVLEQYSNLPDKEQSYDRTLFFNACVALLLIPHAELYGKLPEKPIEDWGIPAEKIEIENQKTIGNVARHIRNAIAHNRFDFDSGDENSSVILDNITFTDKREKKVEEIENFKVTLDYETFKAFVLKIADFALKN